MLMPDSSQSLWEIEIVRCTERKYLPRLASEFALWTLSCNDQERYSRIQRDLLTGPRQEETEQGDIISAQQNAAQAQVLNQRKPLMSFAPSSNKGMPEQVILRNSSDLSRTILHNTKIYQLGCPAQNCRMSASKLLLF